MADVQLPLSGDVNQTINPWTWMLLAQGSQIGLFNINLGRSSDPEFEREVLDKVGSYGRQIGRISEVLAIMVQRAGLLETKDLSHAERAAVLDFMGQAETVAALKEARQASEARNG